MAARSVTAGRFVTIHGHFYQPPRENPWLEAVEVQHSAAPYHDWNERVTAECYAPNTAARRVGADNRILDIVNNFDAAALPERVFEVSEEARSLGLELDSAAARPIIRLMVGRGLDVGFGLWHTQNRVFALWREHPEARDTLRPLVDTLGLALAGQATP